MNRFFESASHASLYARVRPDYPDELFEKIFGYLEGCVEPPHERALDVACGTGISTRRLAHNFESVVGIDVSENMIKEARLVDNPDNVTFEVSGADKFPLEDETLDLITIANAAHWVNKEKLYAEAERTLKPNGVLAMYGYGRPRLSCPQQPGAGVCEEFSQMMDFFISTPTWPPGAVECFDKYRSYQFPFPDWIRDDTIEIVCDWPIIRVLGYVGSIAGVQNFIRDNPDQSDILVRFGQKFVQTLPDPSKGLESIVRISWDVFILMGKKPHTIDAGLQMRASTDRRKHLLEPRPELLDFLMNPMDRY